MDSEPKSAKSHPTLGSIEDGFSAVCEDIRQISNRLEQFAGHFAGYNTPPDQESVTDAALSGRLGGIQYVLVSTRVLISRLKETMTYLEDHI